MPFSDWQFWIVTALAVIGLLLVRRAVWPTVRRGASKRVILTINSKGAKKRYSD